jgi:phage terminase large subunit-like protein
LALSLAALGVEIDPERLASLTDAERQVIWEQGQRYLEAWSRRKFWTLFPEVDTRQPDGTVNHARTKYPKHMEFFRAGAKYRERCFLAANRIGKSVTGAYEAAAHLTGMYPDWWEGRRFDGPVRVWVAGKTNETTRDILQGTMLGDIDMKEGRKVFTGTGIVPGEKIGAVVWKQGVSDLADTVRITHKSGGESVLGFKSYQQGRGSFEGTAQHVVWFDEEPPLDVYGEALIRTATVQGIVLLTFTPLEGLSETVLQFMPDDQRPGAA